MALKHTTGNTPPGRERAENELRHGRGRARARHGWHVGHERAGGDHPEVGRAAVVSAPATPRLGRHVGRHASSTPPAPRVATSATVTSPRSADGQAPASVPALPAGAAGLGAPGRLPLDAGGWATLAVLVVASYDVMARSVNRALGEHILASSSELAHRLDPRRLLDSPAVEWIGLVLVLAARSRARAHAGEPGSAAPGMQGGH